MFKKSLASARHKKRAQQLRHRTTEDDDEDDHDGDRNLAQLSAQLTETKKRRQLLTQLQYKRGVDAADLLSSQSTALSTAVDAERDMTKKQQVARTQTQTSTTSSSEGYVWDQKHEAAMEDFVQQQLQKKQQEEEQQQPTNDSEIQTQSNNSVSKEDLYHQLARRAAQLSGKPLAGNETNSAIGTVGESADTSHEVLTAGAATAMAEVVLPVEHDLTVIAETARVVAQRRHHHQQKPSNSMPNRVVPSANAAVPNRFRTYNNVNVNVVQHQQQYQGDQSQQQYPKNDDAYDCEDNDGRLSSSTVPSVSSTVAAKVPAPDQDRLGFSAARQQQQQNRQFQHQASEKNSQKHGRSSDERVYRQFIKRQREQYHR